MNLDLCGDSYVKMQDKIDYWLEAIKNYGIFTQIAHITYTKTPMYLHLIFDIL